jgi:hypothetical protein
VLSRNHVTLAPSSASWGFGRVLAVDRLGPGVLRRRSVLERVIKFDADIGGQSTQRGSWRVGSLGCRLVRARDLTGELVPIFAGHRCNVCIQPSVLVLQKSPKQSHDRIERIFKPLWIARMDVPRGRVLRTLMNDGHRGPQLTEKVREIASRVRGALSGQTWIYGPFERILVARYTSDQFAAEICSLGEIVGLIESSENSIDPLSFLTEWPEVKLVLGSALRC